LKPLITKESTVENYFWLWPLFAFQAGLINSGGFIACHRFVTHVTGFGTRVGVEFLQNNYLLGFEMLFIPLGFILGCAVAGYFTEIKKGRFEIPLMILSMLLAIISFAGSMHLFGSFGEPLIMQRDFILLFMLCFAAGLQNAALASMTGGLIRTTHMTGIATDIGLSITRIFVGKNEAEKIWFKLRVYKFLYFAAGASAGMVLFTKWEYWGFAVPALSNGVLSFELYRRLKLADVNVGIAQPAIPVTVETRQSKNENFAFAENKQQ
jgi:uncharacterized membrane protein YoaK (UPF0700 family)